MPSVRLKKTQWDDPVYLEEVLTYGGVHDWKALWQIITTHPFGSVAEALERVLNATPIYGITSLWKKLLNNLRGTF
ncbi:MAG: hypothetical protein HQM16_05380 [Deltaproteobacteria bacterium]|nr:hypothetical protein [Deltaproteobacteria bacterium]